MKIALVHSFYRRHIPSGENATVEELTSGLRARGHEVALISQTTPATPSPMSLIRFAASVARHKGTNPGADLKAFSPDVVHVHNLFPNFGYDWLDSWPGPIVTTLHNYRPFCAKGTAFRDGRQCLDCLEGSSAAFWHACYRDSRLASAPLAWRNRGGVGRDPLLDRSDHTIFLSERSRAIYARAGYLPQSASILPNGLADIPPAEGDVARSGWAFVGRLSPEKGLLELLAHWPFDEHRLTVVGDGPLQTEILTRYGGRPGLRMPGLLRAPEVHSLLSTFQGVVISSRWAEGLPMVLGEALRAGTPVLVRAGSSAADFVVEHGGGTVYTDDADVPNALDAWKPDHARARRVFERHLSQRQWLDALERIYREVR